MGFNSGFKVLRYSQKGNKQLRADCIKHTVLPLDNYFRKTADCCHIIYRQWFRNCSIQTGSYRILFSSQSCYYRSHQNLPNFTSSIARHHFSNPDKFSYVSLLQQNFAAPPCCLYGWQEIKNYENVLSFSNSTFVKVLYKIVNTLRTGEADLRF